MNKHADHGSVWIVFVDVLFNLSALLILVVFMVLSEARIAQTIAAQATQDAQRANRATSDAEQDAANARAQSGRDREARERVEAASGLTPQSIDVVIAIDGTLSMKPVLGVLETTARSVAEIGSRIAPRFRLAVVVYRSEKATRVFPLTEIAPTREGQASIGMRQFNDFLAAKTIPTRQMRDVPLGSEEGQLTGETSMSGNVEPIGDPADIEHGVRLAVKMLLRDSAASTRRVLIVAGDVGPFELGSDPKGIDADDRASEERVRGLVRTLSVGSTDARVLALFTGKTDPSLRYPVETPAFFKSLAAASNGGTYADDPSQITATVVAAMVETPKGNK